MEKLIRIAYNKLDEETRKELGRSSTSEIAVVNENAIVHYFENGSLIYDKKRKHAFSIHGTLFVFWKELGGLESFLGLPTSGVKTETVEGHKGYTVTFQNGSIYYIPFYPKDEELYVKFSIPVIRSNDMLALIFEFINLKPVTNLKKRVVLEPVSQFRNSYINVFFPQQSIAEEAFSEPLATGQVLRNPPIKSRISGLSRLSFVVPNKDKIPLDLDSLLEKCEAYDLSVDPAAKPPESSYSVVVKDDFDFVKKTGISVRDSKVEQPVNETQEDERINKMLGRLRSDLSKKSTYDAIKINQGYKNIFKKVDKDLLAGLEWIGTPHYTKIEAPYRLIISPNKYAHWKYLSNPKQDINSISGRIALWHTQLSTRFRLNGAELDIDEGTKEYFKTIRAIDFKGGISDPFLNSLSQADRSDIVKLTTGFQNKGEFKLEPVEARQLMLTPLGASLNLYGKWEYCPNDEISLINWVHNATMARDHYVKVVNRGVLYPLGHQAVLITITERKFHPFKTGNTAYLRQRKFIVVIEPEKFHRNDNSLAAQKYQFAFNSTRITTLITPNLSNLPDSSPPENPFWPEVNKESFLFNVIGEDLSGKTSEWRMPLIFVDDTLMGESEVYTSMYANAPDEYRSIKLNSQVVTYAESLDNDNTTLETEVLTFGAVVAPLVSVVTPFYELNTPVITRPRPIAFNTDIHDIFRPSPIDNNDFSDISIVPPVENDTQVCKNKLLFAPVIEKAGVILPSIKYLLGNEQSASFVYAEVYKKGGPKSQNPANQMDKFFEAEEEGIDLSFSGKGDKAGGLIRPDMSIKGLTRESTGLIGGNAALQDINSFEAESFFGDLDSGPKLFGIFNLFEVLEDFDIGGAPKFITKALNSINDVVREILEFKDFLESLKDIDTDAIINDIQEILNEVINDPCSSPGGIQVNGIQNYNSLPENIKNIIQSKVDYFNGFISKYCDVKEMIEEKKIKLEWNPKLKQFPSSGSTPAIFNPNPENLLDYKGMEIAVEMTAKSNINDKPGIDIYSKINKFDINIIGTGDLHFLTLKFDKIEFKSTSGKKPEVDVEFNDIQFAGPLDFVNTLTEVIPFDGFSDPPNLDVTENGISAGFSLEIPAITVGVFSLQNVMLGANFTVPFINDPITVKFFFCERHEPFLLTVYVFGGGGFFTLTVTPEGFYILEAGFEFGLCLAMDFGVAKGSVKAMGGVYFSIVKEIIDAKEQNKVTLIGYFHISGEVDVLGLISASILLALDLIYESVGNKVTGEASIKIEVEVLFFSTTVQVKCKKQFAGAKGDPVFAQIMEKYKDEEGKEHDPWREYCEAFA